MSALAPDPRHLQGNSHFLPDFSSQPVRYGGRCSPQRLIVVLIRMAMTRLQLAYGVRPLAGIVKDFLDRGCAGGKQVLARCLIKLPSGKSSEKINFPGGCWVVSFTSTSMVMQAVQHQRTYWSVAKSAIKWSYTCIWQVEASLPSNWLIPLPKQEVPIHAEP